MILLRFTLTINKSLDRLIKYSLCFVLVALSALFISCKDNTSEPPSGNQFQLEIIVKDPRGNPVPNLRISGGNLLTMRDLQGQGIRPWTPYVYKAKLTILDTMHTLTLFEDSIYIVYGEVDISYPPGILGYTTSSGSFVTQDMNRFPGLFTLPIIPETAENDPTWLGTFGILDTARFILYDTTTHISESFDCIIKKALNKFEIIWHPFIEPTPSLYPHSHPIHRSAPEQDRLRSDSTWTLYQNYPNPTNTTTRIEFYALHPAIATLSVFDLLNHEYRSLLNQQKVNQGLNTVYFSLWEK